MNLTPGNKKNLFLGIAAAALIALGSLGAYFYFRGGSDAATVAVPKGKGKGGNAFDPNRAQPVIAEAARKADVNISLNGLGTITPLRTVTVRSRVDGELVKINFTEGQAVRAGDLLAEIDPRPF